MTREQVQTQTQTKDQTRTRNQLRVDQAEVEEAIRAQDRTRASQIVEETPAEEQ